MKMTMIAMSFVFFCLSSPSWAGEKKEFLECELGEGIVRVYRAQVNNDRDFVSARLRGKHCGTSTVYILMGFPGTPRFRTYADLIAFKVNVAALFKKPLPKKIRKISRATVSKK